MPGPSRANSTATGTGHDCVRISEEDELYIANIKLKGIPWREAGGSVAIAVEARGLLLGGANLPLKP